MGCIACSYTVAARLPLPSRRYRLLLHRRCCKVSESSVETTAAPVVRPSPQGASPKTVMQREQVVKSLRQAASPELVAISMVYFVQGVVSLSSLAVSYFLKDSLHQGPAEVAFLEGFGILPWVIKPIYGFASDFLPLFGYRRRSYLVLCGLVGSSAWLLLGTAVMTPFTTVVMLLGLSLGSACSDVVVDSMVVERARGEPQETSGSLQSLCWASAAVGGIISSYFGGHFVQTMGPRAVFKIISVLPLLVALSAMLVNEKPVQSSFPKGRLPTVSTNYGGMDSRRGWVSSLSGQASSLWKAFRQPSIYFPAFFIFVFNATPSVGSAMFFFETNALDFTPEFMGRVTLIGQVAQLLGVGTYRFFLRSVPLKTIFKWSCILGTVIGMSQLILIFRWNTYWGISDQFFVLGDTAVLNAIGQVAFMPVLVLAARLCPEGVEATLFALLMSIANGGGVTGGLLGAGLTKALGVTDHDFTNLGVLVGICVFSNLLPLGLVHLLPEDGDHERTENGKSAKEELPLIPIVEQKQDARRE